MEKSFKFISVVIVLLLGSTISVGCTKADTSNPEQDQGVAPSPDEDSNPPSNNGGSAYHPVTCTTLAECENHDDQEISIVGIYTTYEMGDSKNHPFDGCFQIVLVGG